jgi:hypothetical protein
MPPLARGFFVVGRRVSPSLLLGRMNFLGSIAAVRCRVERRRRCVWRLDRGEMAGEWLGGGWIWKKRREN